MQVLFLKGAQNTDPRLTLLGIIRGQRLSVNPYYRAGRHNLSFTLLKARLIRMTVEASHSLPLIDHTSAPVCFSIGATFANHKTQKNEFRGAAVACRLTSVNYRAPHLI